MAEGVVEGIAEGVAEGATGTQITTQQLVIAALVLVIIYLVYSEYMCEGMSPTRERANKIYNWFVSEDDPKYVDYRDEIDGAHNVEYYDIKNLKTSGKLTPDNVEKIIQ